MADRSESKDKNTKEPEGFGEHARGPASEAAHEQGWDINEEERTQQPEDRPAYYGGKGFDYGAADFGDTPRPTEDTQAETPGRAEKPAASSDAPLEDAVKDILKDRKAS